MEDQLRSKDELIHELVQLRQRSHELEKKAFQLDAILNALPDGITMVDRNAIPVFMNTTATELFAAHQTQSNLGMPERIKQSQVVSEDGSILTPEETPLHKSLTRGEIIKDFMVVSRKDGRPRYTSVSSAPILDGTGEVAGAVLSHKDMTECRTNADILSQIFNSITDGLFA